MLVTIGLLILLFVTYELWGTGIFTARDQHRLKNQFHRELAPGPAGQPRRDRAHDRAQGRHAQEAAPDHEHDDQPEVRGRTARGRDHRRDRDPEDQRRLDLPGRRATRRPREGPGPLSGHAAPGPDRRRRDRRAPHDARRALLPRRRARARRPDPRSGRSRARTPTSSPRHRSRSTPPTTPSSPTAPTPSSRSRAATPATPRGSASSSRRSSCAS